MFCFYCNRNFPKFPSDQKCPRCGKLYDESGYLKTDKSHQKWYGMRSGKTRNNPNPNQKEKRK